MKKLIMLILMAYPLAAICQTTHLSADVYIPPPHLASNSKKAISQSTTRKPQAQLPTTLTTTGGTTTGGVTTGGTTSGANTVNGVVTGGITTGAGATTTGGTTTGGSTFDPATGGVNTGGITTGATTINGITIGGIITGGTNASGVITNGVVTGGTTTGGTTTGGITTGGTTKYSALVVNTNFTIPLVRVNFLVNKPANSTNSLTSTSFFNSVGAGVNLSWGELDVSKDGNNNNTSVDYYNQFGFQLGFLFAANSSAGSSATQAGSSTTTSASSTIFALVAGVSILNFQLGAGYEMGSLSLGQRRGFGTISYAIPMSVLINGGYKILRTTSLQ